MFFTFDSEEHPYRIEILQAGAQIAALVVSIAVAIMSGAITGMIMKFPVWDNLFSSEFFEDDALWEVPVSFTFLRDYFFGMQ